MGYFDDLVPAESGGGLFDDLIPAAEQSAPEPAPVARTMPSNPAGLPPVWDVNVGGKQMVSKLNKLPDGRTVYTVPMLDGRTGIVQRRRDNGELMIKPYESPKGSRGIGRDLKDAVQGQLQGITDVAVNAPARLVDIAVNAPARMIDAGLQVAGIDTSKTPSLDELASRAIGTAPSLDQALANQNEGFRQSTGDSEAGRIGRIGGNVTATMPLGGVKVSQAPTFAANLGSGLLQGSSGAAAAVAGRGDPDIASEAAAGGAAGAVLNALLPPLFRGAVSARNAMRSAAPASPAIVAPSKVIAEASDDVIKQAKIAAASADLPWDGLDAKLQARIVGEVKRAMDMGADIPRGALVRKAVYESQGLTPTRAMVTRDWTDAWREQNLLTEPNLAGDDQLEALRNIYARNNAVIRQNIDELAPRGSAPVEAPAFGAAVRGNLAANERAAAKQVNDAYDAAAAVEGDRSFDAQPLIDYMQNNISMLNATNSGKPVIAYMKKMGIISPKNMQPIVGENGLPGAGFKAAPITMREAVGLRNVVNRAWSSARKAGDDVAEAQLNELRQMLNTAEFQAGGELYRAARMARQAKGEAFENNPLIDKLLSRQKGYNADLIEDSQVFDRAIVKSSPEQFKALWLRVDGQARDQTQAQLADHIKSTVFSNQGRNEAGDVIASAAKLDKVLRDIGPQKLRMIFGEQRAKDLQMLARSLGEISNPPKGTVPQGSAPKISFLSRALLSALNFGGRSPVGGEIMAGGADVIKRGGKTLADQAALNNALNIYAPYAREAVAKAGQKAAVLAAPAGGGAGGLLVEREPKRAK